MKQLLFTMEQVTLFDRFTRLVRIALVGLFFVLFFKPGVVFAQQSSIQETVYLQLRWHHQFQFAGYYAAVEKGFYKQEGLDVKLRNGDPDHIPVAEVLSGSAQYAAGNSEVLYQRLLGKPLVALAPIFQHSPSVLIALKSTGIRSVHDLIGKKVMLANKNEDADFLTMLLNEGIEPSKLDIIPSSYQLDDLISGKVDAFNAYTTNEPYLLQQSNIDFNIIDPMSYRIDFYSDIFFTSESEVHNNPLRVEAMLRATLKGWRYAMDNPEEVIELLKTKYQVKKTREHLRFEANEIRKLIIPDLIQIGHINPERWQHMADTFVNAGLIEDYSHFDGFIYENNKSTLPDWILFALLIVTILLIAFSSITFYLHRFNRQLAIAQTTLSQSEERFKALSEATYDGIAIHDRGMILECNKGLSEITGYSHDELIGMNILELVASECMDAVVENIAVSFSDSYEVVGLRKDGSKFWLAMKGKNINYRGTDARVAGFIDISDSKIIEDKLKLSASVFTHAREGIMISDNEGLLIEVNDTFCHITGYSREEVLGKNPSFLKSGRHNSQFYATMWTSLIEVKQWSGEIWNKRKNGEIFAELLTISAIVDTNNQVQNYVALFSDITPMKKHQQQLEHIAHYDLLTNLPNRMLLAERLAYGMLQSDRRELSLAVAYLDLDGFKTINDTYGHDVGDQLLVKISKLMNSVLRDGDTLARIGGDEFVAVLPDLEKMSDCELVLSRLLKAAMSPVSIDGLTLQVSTSIGVTLYPQDGADADQLMRHADQAMYIAKQMGRNRYHLFDINKDKSIQTQHESVENIKKGIKRDEFVLYCQPKVNMKTGNMVGVEALIRWQHPKLGLLLPGDFLPIIDKHLISVTLGEWVIDRALDLVVEWQSLGLEIAISVNIDPFQLLQPDFVDKFTIALAKRPTVKPSLLELEILETSALGDITEVLTIMHSCIALGISFSLDDFGTGFSSLTYLKRLPVAQLKVDQSFVRDMLVDQDDRAIVVGVISLANVFNRKVIAEGVESVEHGTQLLSLGCEFAQGFGIAKPMPPQHIPDWLETWKPDPAWTK